MYESQWWETINKTDFKSSVASGFQAVHTPLYPQKDAYPTEPRREEERQDWMKGAWQGSPNVSLVVACWRHSKVWGTRGVIYLPEAWPLLWSRSLLSTVAWLPLRGQAHWPLAQPLPCPSFSDGPLGCALGWWSQLMTHTQDRHSVLAQFDSIDHKAVSLELITANKDHANEWIYNPFWFLLFPWVIYL